MLRKLCVLSLPIAMAVVAACGGKVVFVDDGDDGQGGAGTTSSTSKNTGATTKATTQTVTTHSATFASTGSMVTSSTGFACDTGVPGDGGSSDCFSCQDCSFQGPCMAALDLCTANPDCFAFNDCLVNCGSPDCQAACEAAFPEGSQLLYDLASCVFCDACPVNCSSCNEFP